MGKNIYISKCVIWIHLTKIYSFLKSKLLIYQFYKFKFNLINAKYMWYLSLSLLMHVDFRLTPDLPWLYVDFRWSWVDRPPTSTSTDLFRYISATSWLPSWMTTSGNPGIKSWPLTSHHKTLLFQFLKKRKKEFYFGFHKCIMFEWYS